MATNSTEQITVNCTCGKRLKAPATAVGKRAKCPKCGTILTIEAPPPDDDDMGLNSLYELADQESRIAEKQHAAAPATASGMRCPTCSASLAPGAVLCVNCGFDLRTKQKLRPKVESGPAPAAATRAKGGASAWPGAGKQKAEDDDSSSAAGGNWFIGVLLGFAAGAVAGAICFFIWWKVPGDYDIFTRWAALLIGAAAGFGVAKGYNCATHFAGMTAAAITLLVYIAAKIAVGVAIFAPLVSEGIATSKMDRDERVHTVLMEEQYKKDNLNEETTTDEQDIEVSRKARERLAAMPEAEYQSYLKKVEAEEETQDIVDAVMMDLYKEKGLNRFETSTAQDKALEIEAKQRVAKMTPAQRTAKLAAAQRDDDDDADATAVGARGGSNGGASSSDDDDSGLGLNNSAIGLGIILVLLFLLWTSIPAIVAMAISWKIAANA